MCFNKEMKTFIFELIQGQLNRIMIANSSDEYAVRVIDPATVPTRYDKLRPRKALMLIAGTMFGVFIATIVVLLLQTASGPTKRETEA